MLRVLEWQCGAFIIISFLAGQAGRGILYTILYYSIRTKKVKTSFSYGILNCTFDSTCFDDRGHWQCVI